MKYSNKTKLFAQQLVENHARYDALAECYDLCIDDLYDFDLQKLASLVYMDNPDFATESTGPDNDAYDRHMMPALLIHLKNPLDKDAAIQFNSAWLEGVTNYARNAIDSLLMEELTNYNSDHHEAA